MRYYGGIGIIGLSLVSLFTGCGGGNEPVAANPDSEVQPASYEQPLPPMERKARVAPPQEFGDARSTVEGFLRALSSRNENQVAHLLSKKAREEAAIHNNKIGALGSDTARFEVGAAKKFQFSSGEEGQEIDCAWHDHDEQGAPQSFSVSYLVRQEEGRWRVCGMRAALPGSTTTVLFNFEDFNSMEANRRLAEAELHNKPVESTAAADGSKEQR